MKKIKENAITEQKKIIAELRENFGSEEQREKAIAKLNLIVDDYEKDNNVIDAENIHLFYEFMNDEDLKKYADILDDILQEHLLIISEELNISSDILIDNSNIQTLEIKDEDLYLKISIFNNRDILQPIDEYIKEIRNSNDYKQYRFNYLVETYDLSITHLEKLEYELFADDLEYKSNIDNLIHTALDNVADDFKMNVINYIEDNYLQDETGINCISDITVIIKDGEYQGIFKEFESYGLNDFSVQNITMFIDRYKEIGE